MKNLSFFIFIFVITLILSLGCFYISEKIFILAPDLNEHRFYVYITLFLFIGLQILGPMQYRIYPDWTNRPFILQWLTYITLGFMACLFFYILLAELFTFVGSFFVVNVETFEHNTLIVVAGLTLFSAAAGIYQAVQGLKVVKVSLKFAKFKALSGLKILQISDLHVGPTIGKNYAQKVVDLSLAEKPDLIVLTGDIIDGNYKDLKEHIEPLRQLSAPHGVYYVTGNHEYYWGALQWIEKFQEFGFKVLMNQNHVIEVNGQALAVVGVTDHNAGRMLASHKSDPQKAFAGISNHAFKLFLAHQPSSYKLALPYKFHLQLSGHTHGGQFFPWSIAVALTQKFYRGLYQIEEGHIYTNPGTGYWGPPLRFTVPPEITLIELN